MLFMLHCPSGCSLAACFKEQNLRRRTLINIAFMSFVVAF